MRPVTPKKTILIWNTAKKNDNLLLQEKKIVNKLAC